MFQNAQSAQSVSCFKTVKCFKHDMCPKSVFASKQGNVLKWNKETSKQYVYPLIKV